MENMGEIDTQIAHKRHKIIKLTYPKSRIECLKIFTFLTKEEQKINLYRDHFENVREWLRLRFSSRSFLKMLDKLEPKMETKEVQTQLETFFKVTTQFCKFPTLETYYRRVELNSEKEKKIPLSSLMYYIEEFFEVILRGGSITNFFYTPHNIFICRPPPLQDREIGRFSVNFLSTVGLQFLIRKQNIIKEDLEEIFPLLPLNLRELLQEKDFIEINRIIKMKAFAWNILSFIVGYVPNVLIRQTLGTTVPAEKVFALLQETREGPKAVMRELLSISEPDIQKAKEQTDIDFEDFFRMTLVQNCQKITWNNIYSKIFVQNREAKNRQIEYKKKHQENSSTGSQGTKGLKSNFSETILKSLWIQEERYKTDRFYKERSIPVASNVYFLVKTNIRFRSMMAHFNLLEFLFETKQSRDAFKGQLAFVEATLEQIQGLDKNFMAQFKSQEKRIPAPYKYTSEGVRYAPFDPCQIMKNISDCNPDHPYSEIFSDFMDRTPYYD